MIALLILVPLAGAVLAILVPRRHSWAAGLLGALATSLHVFLTVAELLDGRSLLEGDTPGAMMATLGGWAPPLGIELRLDGLGALLLLVMAGVGLAVSVYTAGFVSVLERKKEEVFPLFWPLWLILWASLNGIFVARDLFTFYVLLELGLLAAASLASLSGTAAATVAALRYLLAAMVGSFAYLLGVGLLYSLHGTVDLGLLGREVETGWVPGTALFLMTVGLMVKTAVFPLHFWLPRAHASAPAPVSAVLSGLVIKGSFVILLRLWIELGGAGVTFAWGQLLGGAATASILWGSVQAFRQRRLKLLIAYSTVAQVGIFFLLFPLLAAVSPAGEVGTWRVDAWAGGVLHASSHALAKAALFLAAGLVFLARGSDELEDTRGLARSLPLTTAALALGGLALVGPPLSGSYTGKALLLATAREEGQWWWVPVLHGATLFSLAYVVAMLRFSLLRREEGKEGEGGPDGEGGGGRGGASDREEGGGRSRPSPLSLWIQVIPLGLAAASLLMGWWAGPLRALLLVGEGGGAP